MKQNELVSIIIPCYNQAHYLKEAVQSAVDQTYPNIEIIIVNDGSPDNTQEIAEKLQKKYPKKITIITQKNMGLYAARNNGIDKSSGIFIVPLDADDKLDQEMLSKCMVTLKKYKSDIVYVGYKRFGTMDTSNPLKSFSDSNPLYVTPCSATALFKKEIWKKTGGYKKNMSDGYEDWEFWINAYKHSYKFQYHPEILFYYRVKEESMFTNAFKKEDYLQSKIVMNHPELYTKHRVQKSIVNIKEAEELSDYYFYTKVIPKYKEELLTTLNNYLAKNTLHDQQILYLPEHNKKVALFSLDILKSIKHMKQLHKKENVESILFYAPMRYQVPFLVTCDFAWEYGKGIIQAEGTFFSYVFKTEREDIHSQFIAYQRLERYDERKKIILNGLIGRLKRTIQEKEKIIQEKENSIQEKETIIQEKEKIIQEKENSIQEKETIIQEKETIIQEKENIINTLMISIQKIVSNPILKNPWNKYKAYKGMLNTYYRMKKLISK